MIKPEIIQKILTQAYPETNVCFEGIGRATDSITSHDVFQISFNLDGMLTQVILKSVPETIRSPKVYNLFREVSILRSLEDYQKVGVPRVIHTDFSKGVFDREFFLMEMVNGVSMVDLIGKETRRARLSQITEIAHVIADVHAAELARFTFLPQGRSFGSLIPLYFL